MLKIAIIGAGFCGIAAAWHLLNHRFSSSAKVDIFDAKGIGKGTSGIAAGLLHPYAGAHAKLNWRGHEGFQATKKLIEASAKALGHSVIAENKGILRLALNEEQLADFKKCAEKYPQDTDWLDANVCQHLVPGCMHAPGLLIKSGLTIFSSLYLEGLWLACKSLGASLYKRRIHSMDELKHYDITIAAAGSDFLGLPELSSLPLSLVKGQALELAWNNDIPPLACALNSRVYLVMTYGNKSCLVGATYEKGFQTANIDRVVAEHELLPKAFELFPPLKDAAILNCYAGMRAVAPLHRPFLEEISPSQWAIGGMGSKGLLYHALYAEELANKIGHKGH